MEEEQQVPQIPQDEIPQGEQMLEVEPQKDNKNVIISILALLLVIAVALMAYFMFFQDADKTSLTEDKNGASEIPPTENTTSIDASETVNIQTVSNNASDDSGAVTEVKGSVAPVSSKKVTTDSNKLVSKHGFEFTPPEGWFLQPNRSAFYELFSLKVQTLFLIFNFRGDINQTQYDSYVKEMQAVLDNWTPESAKIIVYTKSKEDIPVTTAAEAIEFLKDNSSQDLQKVDIYIPNLVIFEVKDGTIYIGPNGTLKKGDIWYGSDIYSNDEQYDTLSAFAALFTQQKDANVEITAALPKSSGVDPTAWLKDFLQELKIN